MIRNLASNVMNQINITLYLFRWSYLSQYLTYSIGFRHLDIIFDALSENEENIEKFQKQIFDDVTLHRSIYIPQWASPTYSTGLVGPAKKQC